MKLNIDLKTSLNRLIMPVIILISIIILIIISSKIIIDRISSLNTELSENQKQEKILEEKLTSLQTLQSNIVENSDIVSLALPATDSILSSISQIKLQAQKSNLLVTSIESGMSTDLQTAELKSTPITFEIVGKYQDIFSFAKNLRNSLPINRFDIININPSSNVVDGFDFEATLFAYSAPLPLTIPAINEPVVELTNEEKQLLSKISSFEKPLTVTGEINEATNSSTGKPNPFQ